jgi:hypothetical protein
VLSKPEVHTRLANDFVGVRFDWEQGNHYKPKLGFIPGTGDQVLLTPAGELIRSPSPDKPGGNTAIHGRHGRDTTGAVLEEVSKAHPVKNQELKLDWFLWPQKAARRPGGRYPVPYAAIAGYARLPYIVVDGPLPPALEDAKFLRWHVRQFIWVRGNPDAPARLSVRRVADGLKAGLRAELAVLDPATLTRKELGAALDKAWLAYMKDRPLTARGYLENQHGKWMRNQAQQMITEDDETRARAAAGTLMAPGRKQGEAPPYE